MVVLMGYKSRGIDRFHDVSKVLLNNQRNKEQMISLLVQPYKEVYGDCVQVFHLMNILYEVSLSQSKFVEMDYFEFMKLYEPTVAEPDAVSKSLQKIDSTFGDDIGT